jgi:hypothetical protein
MIDLAWRYRLTLAVWCWVGYCIGVYQFYEVTR